MNPSTDVQILNVYNALSHNRKQVVVSTEESCWIGRICSRADVDRFRNLNISTKRFIHSQYMGHRIPLLHMLDWGIKQHMTDDMAMIYLYTLNYPEYVALDEHQQLFGSLAITQSSLTGPYSCWEGSCTAKKSSTVCLKRNNVVCIENACPILWHANGPISESFLNRNPKCLNRMRFLGKIHNKFIS